MKFELCTTKNGYSNEEEINSLKGLGFRFDGLYIVQYTNIEFNSFEEFMKFVKKYAPVIISEDTIEIYNDYRE